MHERLVEIIKNDKELNTQLERCMYLEELANSAVYKKDGDLVFDNFYRAIETLGLILVEYYKVKNAL